MSRYCEALSPAARVPPVVSQPKSAAQRERRRRRWREQQQREGRAWARTGLVGFQLGQPAGLKDLVGHDARLAMGRTVISLQAALLCMDNP